VTDFDSKDEFLAKLAQALGGRGIASQLHYRGVLEFYCYLFSIDRYEERCGNWRGREVGSTVLIRATCSWPTLNIQCRFELWVAAGCMGNYQAKLYDAGEMGKEQIRIAGIEFRGDSIIFWASQKCVRFYLFLIVPPIPQSGRLASHTASVQTKAVGGGNA
jgi:hypothetical protein